MKSVEKKLLEIEDRVSRLRELSSNISSSKDYQASRNYREIVERNLQVAIEGCLDVGKIIISRGSRKKGIFVVLTEVGILRKESLSSLIPMAGTRNILVHGYDKIEDVQVYGILKKKAGRFPHIPERHKRQLKSPETRGPEIARPSIVSMNRRIVLSSTLRSQCLSDQ